MPQIDRRELTEEVMELYAAAFVEEAGLSAEYVVTPTHILVPRENWRAFWPRWAEHCYFTDDMTAALDE